MSNGNPQAAGYPQAVAQLQATRTSENLGWFPWMQEDFGKWIRKDLPNNLAEVYNYNFNQGRAQAQADEWLVQTEAPVFCCEVLDAQTWTRKHPKLKQRSHKGMMQLEKDFRSDVRDLVQVIVLHLRVLVAMNKNPDAFKPDMNLTDSAATLDKLYKEAVEKKGKGEKETALLAITAAAVGEFSKLDGPEVPSFTWITDSAKMKVAKAKLAKRLWASIGRNSSPISADILKKVVGK
ncbi:hypothetical protein B0T24DRAFT_591140 [Lasiosphaeria ovina]|uniref:Uncharacterized protein n=1 Tax=Lasiosphaeria ovina TaxID=92902 RepID=A0AAE0NFR1_9PEZI|nr:hypothetical protein B0T24DRAFT_591140 [Lasiosphaeria ovina]